MSKIKTAHTSSEPAVSTDKGFLLARQQAEIKSGEALLRGISQTDREQHEKARSSDQEEEQEDPKDTAEISEARRWMSSDGTGSVSEVLRWILEMEEAWEAFLGWQPDPGLDLPAQLQQLSKLYLTLLEAALKYAEGENLTEQLERLDSILAQKLNLVMEQKLKQLISLLKETGQTETLDSIRSGLYRQTAGRTLSPQAARTLFAQGRQESRGSTGRSGAAASFRGEGMVYQSSGKLNSRFQETYHTQQNSWKEQIRQRNEAIRSARNGIAEHTFQRGRCVSCSGRELEKAERFAGHIAFSGNLFKNPGISARNEEVTGLLAAVMFIKGQVYAGESRESGSMAHPLQNAIIKIIDQYLGPKGASHVYYHTLTAYRQMQDPHKAIEDGQDYAYRRFQEKQRDPAFQRSPHYSRESGFFRTLLKGLSAERELALGMSILQKDWQNFLCVIGNRQNSSYLSGMEIRSPWGVLADTGIPRAGSSKKAGKLLLGAAVLILMAALAVIGFRLI
ncbi:hypothetical protein D3Z50_12300 [Clostridiaceae bacterium]|nr:hypothetical protein [Clostridiaceae bacterium]